MYFVTITCVCVSVTLMYVHHTTHVKVRESLCKVGSCLLPFCEFPG